MSIQLLRQTLREVQKPSQHEMHIRKAIEIYKEVSRNKTIYLRLTI